MAERRKTRKRKDEDASNQPTKVEYAVAKHLRFNLANKKSTMYGNKVEYFQASKAVDCLLDSKWATAKAKEEALFTTRQSCTDYLNRLLQKELFHRAHKQVKKVPEKKKKTDKDEEKKKDASKESEKEKKDKESEGEKKEENGGKKKEKKKVKLEMHDDQVFIDGKDVYVWIYDPISPKMFILGLLIVFGAIGVCLFPLWPPEVRLGVYYLSLVAAAFVGSIIALAIIRLILFACIWAVSFGRHHYWLFPNLLEDVGFFDSFKPLYSHEYRGDKEEKEKKEEKENAEEKTALLKEEAPQGSESEKSTGSEQAGEEDFQNGTKDNDFVVIKKEEAKEDSESGGSENES